MAPEPGYYNFWPLSWNFVWDGGVPVISTCWDCRSVYRFHVWCVSTMAGMVFYVIFSHLLSGGSLKGQVRVKVRMGGGSVDYYGGGGLLSWRKWRMSTIGCRIVDHKRDIWSHDAEYESASTLEFTHSCPKRHTIWGDISPSEEYF